MLRLLEQVVKEYRDRILEIVGSPLRKPWMRYREMEIVEEVLRNLRPRKCLEWGAGYSTMRFPKVLQSGAKWIAVEHDYQWFNQVSDGVGTNVEVFYVPPNNFPWTDQWQDGSYSDLHDYIEFPEGSGDSTSCWWTGEQEESV